MKLVYVSILHGLFVSTFNVLFMPKRFCLKNIEDEVGICDGPD